MVIVIAGKQVDLNAVLPLKLRHWKELEKVGITDGKLRDNASATLISQLMYYVLNKADASVTQDMVDDEFTINDPRLIEIAHAIVGEKADRPT